MKIAIIFSIFLSLFALSQNNSSDPYYQEAQRLTRKLESLRSSCKRSLPFQVSVFRSTLEESIIIAENQNILIPKEGKKPDTSGMLDKKDTLSVPFANFPDVKKLHYNKNSFLGLTNPFPIILHEQLAMMKIKDNYGSDPYYGLSNFISGLLETPSCFRTIDQKRVNVIRDFTNFDLGDPYYSYSIVEVRTDNSIDLYRIQHNNPENPLLVYSFSKTVQSYSFDERNIFVLENNEVRRIQVSNLFMNFSPGQSIPVPANRKYEKIFSGGDNLVLVPFRLDTKFSNQSPLTSMILATVINLRTGLVKDEIVPLVPNKDQTQNELLQVEQIVYYERNNSFIMLVHRYDVGKSGSISNYIPKGYLYYSVFMDELDKSYHLPSTNPKDKSTKEHSRFSMRSSNFLDPIAGEVPDRFYLAEATGEMIDSLGEVYDATRLNSLFRFDFNDKLPLKKFHQNMKGYYFLSERGVIKTLNFQNQNPTMLLDSKQWLIDFNVVDLIFSYNGIIPLRFQEDTQKIVFGAEIII